MANHVISALNINNHNFVIEPCWQQLGLTQGYMLALLGRDEYTPVANQQPTPTDVFYTDPDSDNLAGVHAGQCVIYPDDEIEDGWGLSIAKKVITDANGIPTKVHWYHATDVEKRVRNIEIDIIKLHYGCLGTGLWINDYPWQNDAAWDNAE